MEIPAAGVAPQSPSKSWLKVLLASSIVDEGVHRMGGSKVREIDRARVVACQGEVGMNKVEGHGKRDTARTRKTIAQTAWTNGKRLHRKKGAAMWCVPSHVRRARGAHHVKPRFVLGDTGWCSLPPPCRALRRGERRKGGESREYCADHAVPPRLTAGNP